MSYTNLLYHIIFRTKASENTIPFASANILYNYIWGLVRNKGCTLVRIGGMPDHVHMLVELRPSVAVADFVRVVKVESSKFAVEHPQEFPYFKGWAREYCALTYSKAERDTVSNYIRNQQKHHLGETFYAELMRMLNENGLEDKASYFFSD